MKKFAAAIAMMASVAATDAMAESEKFYGELGYALPKAEFSGYSATPTVVAARIGMKFTDNIAGEVFLGTSARSDSIDVGGTPVRLKVKDVIGLYVKGSLPVADKFSVFGRVGYLRAKAQASTDLGSASDSDSGFSYGAGVQFDFTNTVYGIVDYMSWYDQDGTTVSGPTIGIGFKF